MTDTLSDLAEMESILQREHLGYLGLADRDGRPYVVPLNYSYNDGRILFHCALEGAKLDCIRANPSVCFVVGRQIGDVREHHGEPCHVDSDSVLCFGTARIVEDLAERALLLNLFNRRYRPSAEDIPQNRVAGCGLVEIRLTELTGRRERARQRTLWRHMF